jgi:hypothetical protein
MSWFSLVLSFGGGVRLHETLNPVWLGRVFKGSCELVEGKEVKVDVSGSSEEDILTN